MFKKLKKQSVITLSLTVILLIVFQIAANYFSYRKILYDDYTSKAAIFSDLHAKNISTYFEQFDQNISIFLNNYDAKNFDGTVSLEKSEYLKDALENMVKYKLDINLRDIIIFSNSGDYISYNNLFNPDVVKECGILNSLKSTDTVFYYNPQKAYAQENSSVHNTKYHFMYGKTFYDENSEPLFYVISLLSTNMFTNVLDTNEYFTKNTSIYIIFGDQVFPIKESKETMLKNPLSPPKSNSGKCFYKNNRNEAYGISIITNTLSNDSSFFINMIIPIMVIFAAIVGLICFLCAKGIVGQIINPLENISIKMKHFK